ncbi:MAG TPA: transporter [Hyphomicrobiaceae bacterium]|jgi:hypothetical protein
MTNQQLSGVARLIFAAGLSVCTAAGPAFAAEDAKSVYLLGSSASMAGFVPPPGTYVSSLTYYYAGDGDGAVAASRSLRRLGNIQLSADLTIESQAAIELMTLLWVAPGKVLGGYFGVGAILPVGWQNADVDVNARAALTLPNGTTLQASRRLSLSDDTFAAGDPLATAFIGWHAGNWHWKLAGLLNVPVGSYDKDALVSMGFNRWAADISGAVTWLDPKIGFEVSATAGFTFNGENPDTDYKTGTEFHVEFALMQHLSKALAVGVAGYHYQQITDDSGAGAKLGGFKGEVTAIGPNLTYNFALGTVPVATSVRWLHEFDAKNRLEGNAGFLTVTIPLGGPARPAPLK